jgi:hypothetical protein
MTKPYDTRLIMMVAQQPFERNFNQFCRLLPVVYVDGGEALESDFPNDGEIWWMLTAQTARLAQPGRLVVGSIENAPQYDPENQNKCLYQAKRETVQDLNMKDGLELINLPGDAIDDLQDLVSGSIQLDLVAEPTPVVMLQWRSHLYGPLHVSLESGSDVGASKRFRLAPHKTDMTVYCVDEATFHKATKGDRFVKRDKVSPIPASRVDTDNLQDVRHDLLLASGFERVVALNPERIPLEPIGSKLRRYAKHCLTRKKLQHFRDLLEELELKGRDIDDADDLRDAI